MRRIVTLIIVLLLAVTCFAEVYQWRDADGNIVFSDKPVRGAKRITIRKPQVYSSDNKTQNGAPLIAPVPKERPKVRRLYPTTDANTYKRVAITKPRQQETIRDSLGRIQVTVDVEPPLKEGNQIILYLDGNRIGLPHPTNRFSIQGIHRGTHALQAVIIDEFGTEIGRSDTTIIYMQPPRIQRR